MAKDKKSFMLYADQNSLFNKLPDEKAGQLIKLIFSFINDENPKIDDLILEIAFEPIKMQLKRDLKKWEERAKNSRINGTKGGRPRNPEEPKKPSGLFINPEEPKKPVNDNVNVNDNVLINIIEFLKDKANTELIFMNNSISPNLIDKYTSDFINKLIQSDAYKEKSFIEVKNWFINWVKKMPKNEFIYLTKDDILNKGLNTKREYIKADNSQGYHALMNNDEKIKSGFETNQLVTIHKEVIL